MLECWSAIVQAMSWCVLNHVCNSRKSMELKERERECVFVWPREGERICRSQSSVSERKMWTVIPWVKFPTAAGAALLGKSGKRQMTRDSIFSFQFFTSEFFLLIVTEFQQMVRASSRPFVRWRKSDGDSVSETRFNIFSISRTAATFFAATLMMINSLKSISWSWRQL